MIATANIELIQIADAVAKDKSLPRDIVIDALESAIEAAAKKKYGQEHSIKAQVSKKDGAVSIYRILTVSNECLDFNKEISLKDAIKEKPDAKIGDEIYRDLPPIDIKRIAAQSAKQVIIQKVKEAERESQYNEFKDRVGEILNVVVKRIEYGNVVVDLGRVEAVIKKDQLIKTDNFRINDRVKAYIYKVSREVMGPQIFLSRTDPGMLAKLFEIEVPEIYEKIIQIKSVSREPGSRAKIAVFSSDSGLDPVGACIGMKGARVKAIINELNGEKIDVIEWNSDLVKFVIASLSPAEIAKVIIDEQEGRIEVIVPEDQLSSAIGKQGQNVRLASRLVGWNIDILTEDQESKRKLEHFNNVTQTYMKELDLDETLAQLLAAEGYSKIEHLVSLEAGSLSQIEGIDEQIESEIIARANQIYEQKQDEIINKLEHLGVEQDLVDAIIVDPEHLLKLAEYGVKTIEDLAEMSLEEFKNLLSKGLMTDEEILELIESAKQKVKDQEK